MTSDRQTNEVHLPSLAAELPPGWTAAEEVILRSPSGSRVRVSLGRADDGETTSDLIDRHEAAVRVESPGIERVSSAPITLRAGQAAKMRQFSFDREGVPWTGRIVCSVVDGMALAISTSWATEHQAVETDVDVAVAGIRLLHRPLVAHTGAGADVAHPAPAPPPPPPRRPVDGSAWTAARDVWSRAIPGEVELTNAGRWSAEELAVCAAIMRATAFPTVGPEVLGSLPEVALDATVATVMHSFAAKGLTQLGDDAVSVRLVGDLGDLVDIAVFPDLAISVTRFDADGGADRWYGLRPARAVEITRVDGGSRRCAEMTSADVVGHMLASVGVDAAAPGAGETLPRFATIDDIVGGGGDLVALVRVITAWRETQGIRGGALTWAIGADGSVWSADDDTSAGPRVGWQFRPTGYDTLRAELLDHLPGA